MQKYLFEGDMFQMLNHLISRHGLSPTVQMGEKTCFLQIRSDGQTLTVGLLFQGS